MRFGLRSLSKGLLIAVTMGGTMLGGWTQPTPREQAVLDAIAQVSVTHILIQGLVRVCGANLDAQVPQEILNSAKGAAMGRLNNLSARARFEGTQGLNQLVFPKTGNLHQSMEIAVEEMSIDSTPDVACDMIYDILKQQYDASFAVYGGALAQYRDRR